MFPHDFPFDPAYGFTASTLRQVPAPKPPADFADFWTDVYTRTRAVDPDPVLRPLTSPDPTLELFEIDYTSLGGFRVGGWLTRRTGRHPRSAAVVGHGYGGRDAADAAMPAPPDLAIFPCARGFNRSARADLPNDSPRHVVHGIESRDTYLPGLCVADLFGAVTCLLSLHPDLQTLAYRGGSFGGGLGALMLPWEPRITRAMLDIPTFGNHPLRLTLPGVGSGESLRIRHRRRGDVAETLRYFDAASAATFCHTPTLVAAALFDPCVAPPGQFAIYNALAGEKRLLIRRAAHFDFPQGADDNAAVDRAVVEWFSDAAPMGQPAVR